jgi:hypothetical protein
MTGHRLRGAWSRFGVHADPKPAAENPTRLDLLAPIHTLARWWHPDTP